MAMDDEFVWLVNPDTKGTWKCPVGAVGLWTARGWENCDPPDEPDVTKDPAVVEAEIESEPAPSARAKKRAAAAAAATEEGAE
jgi:hypothetical protein